MASIPKSSPPSIVDRESTEVDTMASTPESGSSSVTLREIEAMNTPVPTIEKRASNENALSLLKEKDVTDIHLAEGSASSLAKGKEAAEIEFLQADSLALEEGKAKIVVQQLVRMSWHDWLNKDMIAFFILGLIIPLPTMVITTASNIMFSGITGVFGICLSFTAATTSFVVPLFIHLIPYNVRILVGIIASVVSFVVCTLGTSEAGPAFGTILAGFVYAFGTNLFLAVAAFYDQRTVIAFSTGSGFCAVLGPSIYIGLMQAFQNNYKKTFLVCIPFPFLQALIWWFMLSMNGRRTAEETRVSANARDTAAQKAHKEKKAIGVPKHTEEFGVPTSVATDKDDQPSGFSSGRTRIGLFWHVILPKYVLPLSICTSLAIVTLFGLAPTFQTLNSYKVAPTGDLNFQLNFLAYGSAQFLFASISIWKALPQIWLWAILQISLVAIGIVQLFVPFLTYYPIWIIFIFLVGGVVGASVTNTNYKIAEDFRKSGEAEDVRAFAMSYGGLGNFGGDALGGGLAIMVQILADRRLAPRP